MPVKPKFVNSIILNSATPWLSQTDVPMEICDNPGQIEVAERMLFYWLARNCYTGAGEIVEIGALLGASSSCFARGILDNPGIREKRNRLHVFDKFETFPDHAGDFFPRSGVTGYKAGDDFSPLYRKFMRPYAKVITVTKVDIADITWSGQPIEILFVDCAASAELGERVIQVFYPYLIPGVSLVVDQDYFFQRAWWLTCKSAALIDALHPTYSEDSTMVAKCRSAIDRSRLDLGLDRLTMGQKVELLMAMERAYPPAQSQLVSVQRAHCVAEAGDKEAASKILKDVLLNVASAQARYRALAVAAKFNLQ
jgi:hypothetical protein